MGFLSRFSSFFARKEAARKASLVESARHDMEMRAISMVEGTLVRYVDSTEAKWARLSGQITDVERVLSEGDRKEQLAKVVNEARLNPLIKNALRKLRAFVMGSGVNIDSENEAAGKAWLEWQEESRFDSRADEIFTRLIRDGEVFIRVFGSGPSTKIRFIDPERVEPPKDLERGEAEGENWEHGIITDIEDAETILGYWVQHGDDDENPERVPADEVIFAKIGSDSTSKRGESEFVAALLPSKRLEIEREYMFTATQLRLSIAMVKKVHAGSSGLTTFRDEGKVDRSDPENENAGKVPRPGTIKHINDGVEYDFVSPNLDAPDILGLFRDHRLEIAAAIGCPEWLVSENADTANYASALTQSDPFIRICNDWRDTISPIFKMIYVIVTGDKKGSVSWPRLVEREWSEDSDAAVKLTDRAIMSKETAQERLGLDPETEEVRLGQEEGDRDEEAERIAQAVKMSLGRDAGGGLGKNDESEER